MPGEGTLVSIEPENRICCGQSPELLYLGRQTRARQTQGVQRTGRGEDATSNHDANDNSKGIQGAQISPEGPWLVSR